MSDVKNRENLSEVTDPGSAGTINAEAANKKELHPLLQSFYTETDPEKRLGYLQQYLAGQKAAGAADSDGGTGSSGSAADSGGRTDSSGPAVDAYRQALFEARHVDKKHPGKLVDRFLWHIMTLLTIYKTPGFFPKRHKREVLSILKQLRVDDRPLTDKACEEALYREYRNAVRRYYASCSDPSYGRSLFGMVIADADKRASMISADLWSFTRGISQMVGLEEEMTLLSRAANDEYCALVPEAESLEEAYRRLNPKK